MTDDTTLIRIYKEMNVPADRLLVNSVQQQLFLDSLRRACNEATDTELLQRLVNLRKQKQLPRLR